MQIAKFLRFLGLLLLTAATAQAQVQRYMVNPSFESPALGGSACYGFTASASVTGWTSTEPTGVASNTLGSCTSGQEIGANAIEIWRNNFNGVAAYAGSQHVELNAHNAARLSQTICMQTGDEVTWAYSHRARSPSTVDVANFSVGSSTNTVNIARTSPTGVVTSTSADCSSSSSITSPTCSASTSSSWGRYTGTFTWQGSGGNQSVGFEATNGGSLGNFLDDVQFTVRPMVEFPSADLPILESAGTANFQLRVVGRVPVGGMVVPFTITGTATGGGVDYTLPNTFTVPAGDYAVGATVNVPVLLNSDSLAEDAETVIIAITPPAVSAAYRLGSTVSCGGTAIGRITLSITDDDVSVTLNKSLVPASDSGLFNLSITGGSPTGGTNPAGNQGNGGSTGAVKVNPSTLITLAETAETAETAGTSTSLANYSTALSCVDGSATSVPVTGSGTSRTITTPALTASAAARTITCTYTNTAKLATITLKKALAGDRMAVNDQFSVAIRTGGVPGTVVSSATNATTTGTMATVTAGTGTTGSYRAAAGTAYTLTEAAAAGASLTNYSAALTCVDTAGVQTGLPSGVAFNPAVGYAITPVAGAALSCTITNTPILVHPATAPVISCLSDGNIFNTAYNGNPAGPAKTSGLDNVWERGATFGALQPSNWTLADVATTNPGWSAYNAFPASRFVAHQPDTDHNVLGSVDLWYRYVFTMDSSVVLSSFRLAMDFYADNSVQAIYVNGVQQTVAGVPDGNPYNALHYNTGNALSANLTSNWQAGTNTIMVRVSSGPPALGFMAKNTISAVCQSKVSLQKALGGLGRLAANDQFTVDIRTGGVTGTVVNSTANSTTEGSGSTVTAGRGNTGVYLTTAGTAYTLNESMASGSTSALTSYTRSLSCTNVGGTTKVTGFSSLPLTFSPASGDNVLCTVTNTPASASITGRVFVDNGVSSGIANDGLINGSEAGLAGITVRLTNCAATVYASGTTDGAGTYNLGMPTTLAAGASLCVEQPNLSMRISTGASASSIALPSDTPTTVASISYTYTSTPNRIAFAFNGTGHSNLNFGLVPPNTLAPNGAQTAQPGTVVFYAHSFYAGSAGSIAFSLAGASTPSTPAWNQVLYQDVGCTGTLTAASPLITALVNVTVGQTLCVSVKQFVPASAALGAQNTVTLSALFGYTGASPALSRALSATDVTTVDEAGALALIKRVSNLTQGGPGGLAVNAKPGETLQYLLTAINNGSEPLSLLVINDATPAFTTFYSAACPATLNSGLTACSLTQQPAVGAAGSVQWTFTGSLAPSAQFSVSYEVKVNN
jgi:hypothetical protein